MIYLQIAFKLTVAFVFVIVVLRITGKNTMAQMTVIDVIGNMILGSIVGGIVYSTDIKLVDFLIILSIWMMIMLVINYLQMLSSKAKKIIVGTPVELINEGKLIVSALSFCKLDVTDLQTLLRMKGINTINDVEHAQLEPNGQLSVIKKGEADFGYMIVKNGAIVEDALRCIKKDENWFNRELKKEGYTNLDNIFCVEFYDGKITVITKDEVEKDDEKMKEEKSKDVSDDKEPQSEKQDDKHNKESNTEHKAVEKKTAKEAKTTTRKPKTASAKATKETTKKTTTRKKKEEVKKEEE